MSLEMTGKISVGIIAANAKQFVAAMEDRKRLPQICIFSTNIFTTEDALTIQKLKEQFSRD